MFNKPRLLLSLAVTLCGAFNSQACQIPVYRYALERWQADAFDIIVLQRGELNANQKMALDLLTLKDAKSTPPPNASVRLVDLGGAPDPQTQKLWESFGKPELPWVVALFPSSDGMSAPAWTGKLDPQNAKALIDSPARREIARRILKGESAVWVLDESGDTKAAKATSDMVGAALKKNEENLKLPEQDPNDPSSRLSSQLPLRIGFSVLRVRDDDPAEKPFVSMLRKSSRGEQIPTGPGAVAYPIFGRGRCLGAVAGKDLTPAIIGQACSFLAGACSCQVKSMNPGVDLLMSVKWEDFISGSLAVDKELPPLTGLAPAQATLTAPVTATVTGTKASASDATAPVAREKGNLKRNVLAALGAGVILVLGGALVVSLRRGKATPFTNSKFKPRNKF